MAWSKYVKKPVPVEMRPFKPGDNLEGISISHSDLEKEYHLQEGSMIARNSDNHNDQWFVNKDYFNKNYNEAPVE